MDKDIETYIKQDKEMRKIKARAKRAMNRYIIKLTKIMKSLPDNEKERN